MMLKMSYMKIGGSLIPLNGAAKYLIRNDGNWTYIKVNRIKLSL
jgi:hypothetical protein